MAFKGGNYDVIVIGAGHAGSEAALAAARLNCKTVCLTISLDAVALMPCNPAVGGPGKSHLVREVDALGGEIALNADKTYIQIRMLNTGKGPAVRALRCQSDKRMYQDEMKFAIEMQENLDVKQAVVKEIIVNNGEVQGVKTQTGTVYWAPTVILTTGTYMRGRIIMGEVNYSSGPAGQFPSIELSESLKDLGLKLGRFKTGTPARIDGKSVDFSKMSEQRGDEEEFYLSFMSKNLKRPNIPCWLTYTNPKTHEVIKDNLERSPLFSGIIEGVGPRYCPSIEDKVVRFEDKESHQVFLEPEGLRTKEMYVQGMSTSLPEDVQVEMLRSMSGMEKVEITRPGYAIEYDCIYPTQLDLNLMVRDIKGLFSAGQVNGTSGYEEAAAQGIVSGINAARMVKGEKSVEFSRSESYIGVLIDDLVLKGTNEPYRIMTSRAEYRLLLRQDNADFRLTEAGRKIGLVNDVRYEAFLKRKRLIEQEKRSLEDLKIKPGDRNVEKLLQERGGSPLKKSVSLAELLRRPELDFRDIKKLVPESEDIPDDIHRQIWTEIKYAGYIRKQLSQIKRFEEMEDRKLPKDIDYSEINGLRNEAKQKLQETRPQSLGQASRISGVSPADINVLMIYLEQRRRNSGEERKGD